MRIANAPAKKNIRRWRVYDRLEEEIKNLKDLIKASSEEKDESSSNVSIQREKKLKTKLKELAVLKERMVDGDFAITIKNKKYRGAR